MIKLLDYTINTGDRYHRLDEFFKLLKKWSVLNRSDNAQISWNEYTAYGGGDVTHYAIRV